MLIIRQPNTNMSLHHMTQSLNQIFSILRMSNLNAISSVSYLIVLCVECSLSLTRFKQHLPNVSFEATKTANIKFGRILPIQ